MTHASGKSQGDPPTMPEVSVLLCTFGRGSHPRAAVEAVLHQDFGSFELIVLDQNTDDATEAAVRPLCELHSNLVYVRVSKPGKGGALNLGLQIASGRLIALTDDDCEPKSDWLRCMAAALEEDCRTGIVFGDVSAGPFDPAKGYIPALLQNKDVVISRPAEYLRMPGNRNFGMNANAMIRRTVLEKIGGWDEGLCPGGVFRSGDDHDMTFRALLAGFRVRFRPGAEVVHHGFRPHHAFGSNYEKWAAATALHPQNFCACAVGTLGDGGCCGMNCVRVLCRCCG